MYTVNTIDPFLSAFTFVIALMIIIFVVAGLIAMFGHRKSRDYANLLSDMYVVGVIKKLAKNDSIDLHKELKEFNKVNKRAGLSEKGLRSVIEAELKEKVADVQEESLQK